MSGPRGGVAQLARALRSHRRGRGFESHHLHPTGVPDGVPPSGTCRLCGLTPTACGSRPRVEHDGLAGVAEARPTSPGRRDPGCEHRPGSTHRVRSGNRRPQTGTWCVARFPPEGRAGVQDPPVAHPVPTERAGPRIRCVPRDTPASMLGGVTGLPSATAVKRPGPGCARRSQSRTQTSLPGSRRTTTGAARQRGITHGSGHPSWRPLPGQRSTASQQTSSSRCWRTPTAGGALERMLDEVEAPRWREITGWHATGRRLTSSPTSPASRSPTTGWWGARSDRRRAGAPDPPGEVACRAPGKPTGRRCGAAGPERRPPARTSCPSGSSAGRSVGWIQHRGVPLPDGDGGPPRCRSGRQRSAGRRRRRWPGRRQVGSSLVWLGRVARRGGPHGRWAPSCRAAHQPPARRPLARPARPLDPRRRRPRGVRDARRVDAGAGRGARPLRRPGRRARGHAGGRRRHRLRRRGPGRAAGTAAGRPHRPRRRRGLRHPARRFDVRRAAPAGLDLAARPLDQTGHRRRHQLVVQLDPPDSGGAWFLAVAPGPGPRAIEQAINNHAAKPWPTT